MKTTALLINLDLSPDRLQCSAQYLNALEQPWERVAAVDGRLLSPETCRQLNPPAPHFEWFRPLSPGEIGCYLSHLHCWQLIHTRGLAYGLILEDDFAPLVPSLKPLFSALSSIHTAWDVIQLSNTPQRPPRRFEHKLSVTFQPGTGRHTNGTAYLVSLSGAAKLIRHREVFYRPVDFDLKHYWEQDLHVFASTYSLFRQRTHEETPSRIQGRTAYRRQPFPQKLNIYFQKYVYHFKFFMAQNFGMGRSTSATNKSLRP